MGDPQERHRVEIDGRPRGEAHADDSMCVHVMRRAWQVWDIGAWSEHCTIDLVEGFTPRALSHPHTYLNKAIRV